ncbi:uncharacterized protein LOC113205351 isoform X3 [Frankliniella occidentalis]|uniref:Uncharacterized protein LOC113205351 isoform X3 n=1 Tax=Frankliniella occidentalis TaxID=133901 RepID=A0A9C6UBB1_FRAOC|nr:uncharacterized protein LOC113205351 isoform X3 [Frankliniella occidentalis]
MMRELDTVSPVVWPAWCYSGGQPESESSGVASADVLRPHPQAPLASSMASSSSSASSVRPSAASALSGGASAHRKRRSVPRSYESPTTALNGARSAIKSERLSPSGGGGGLVGDSASTSSLSRSGTPSSPPASSVGHPAGTSPAASPSRTASSNNNNSTLNNNNISSHLKAMEDSVTHNYSEFMRNLAAKYQYVHPDEFYSATRNGFPAALDPRFPYKAGVGASPFLMPPLGPLPGVPVPPGVVSPLHHLAAPASVGATPAKESAPSASSSGGAGSASRIASLALERQREREAREREREEGSNHSDAPHKAKSPPSSVASATSAVSDGAHSSLLFSPLFSGSLPGTLPGALPGAVPVMDMSSTQALVSMVQRSHQNQLETYLKGAHKRPAEAAPSPLSPLDLSSGAAPPKKSRKRDLVGGDLYGVDSLLGLPSSLIRSSKERLATRTPPSRALSSPRLAAPGTPPAATAAPGSPSPLTCSALCSTTGHASADCSASDAANIAHWSVGDVCNFVGSIDLCVEYVQAFRDQRIDGSALPLLTEEHLRLQMKMRLGPALKLRSVLAKRLGHCSVCLHCVHCHNVTPSSAPAGATASSATPTTTTGVTSSPPRTPSTSSSGSATPVASGASNSDNYSAASSPKPVAPGPVSSQPSTAV